MAIDASIYNAVDTEAPYKLATLISKKLDPRERELERMKRQAIVDEAALRGLNLEEARAKMADSAKLRAAFQEGDDEDTRLKKLTAAGPEGMKIAREHMKAKQEAKKTELDIGKADLEKSIMVLGTITPDNLDAVTGQMLQEHPERKEMIMANYQRWKSLPPDEMMKEISLSGMAAKDRYEKMFPEMKTDVVSMGGMGSVLIDKKTGKEIARWGHTPTDRAPDTWSAMPGGYLQSSRGDIKADPRVQKKEIKANDDGSFSVFDPNTGMTYKALPEDLAREQATLQAEEEIAQFKSSQGWGDPDVPEEKKAARIEELTRQFMQAPQGAATQPPQPSGGQATAPPKRPIDFNQFYKPQGGTADKPKPVNPQVKGTSVPALSPGEARAAELEKSKAGGQAIYQGPGTEDVKAFFKELSTATVEDGRTLLDVYNAFVAQPVANLVQSTMDAQQKQAALFVLDQQFKSGRIQKNEYIDKYNALATK